MKGSDRILIVEDKENLRTVLRKTLEAEGFGVDEAPDGSSALEKIRRDRFAMILSDLRLPRADGHAVLKAAVLADPEMPVILMTAQKMRSLGWVAKLLLRVGSDATVIEPSELMTEVSALARRTLDRYGE